MKNYRKFKVFALVLTLVLGLSIMGTGGAFAAGTFTVHTTTVSATINEALTVSVWAGDHWSGSGNSYSWTVNAYPGETKTLALLVHNAGSVDLGVYVSSDSTSLGGVGYYVAPAGNDVQVNITWTIAADSLIGGPYTASIWINR